MTTSRRMSWFAWAVAVALTSLGVALGMWQLQRAAQKVALHDLLQARTTMPALDLNVIDKGGKDSAPLSGTEWHYRAARVEGVWQPQASVWINNREMDGVPGFWLVTPLQLASGRSLLVLRGWRARDRDRLAPPALPALGQPAIQRVQLTGVLLPQVPAMVALGEDDPNATLMQNLNTQAFAQARGLRLMGAVLQQTQDATLLTVDGQTLTQPDGLGRRWSDNLPTPERNYGYAVQWFALAVLTIVWAVWVGVIRPRRAMPRASPPVA